MGRKGKGKKGTVDETMIVGARKEKKRVEGSTVRNETKEEELSNTQGEEGGTRRCGAVSKEKRRKKERERR